MKKYYLFFFMLLMYSLGFSQQTFNTQGGSGSTTNFNLDWSVGELTLTKTEQTDNLIFTQGLLQGKIQLIVASSNITDGELKILPNPTPGILYIQTGFLQQGKMQVLVYDALGQKIINQQEILVGFSTKTINLSRYANGTYLLKIFFTPTGGYIKNRTYKIIKL